MTICEHCSKEIIHYSKSNNPASVKLYTARHGTEYIHAHSRLVVCSMDNLYGNNSVAKPKEN